jgi:hypothetical protein
VAHLPERATLVARLIEDLSQTTDD